MFAGIRGCIVYDCGRLDIDHGIIGWNYFTPESMEIASGE